MKNYLLKSVLMLAVLFSATAIYAYDFEAVNEDGVTIYYNIISTANKTCEVTYRGTSYDEYNEYAGSVIIPKTVTYSSISFNVTTIGIGAFYGCNGLTSVTIPNSITTIGKGAFYGCNGLTSVTIPNSVTSIEDFAFKDCNGLTFVTIPNSVTSIKWGTFELCSGLTSVTIPNSVTSIGEYAFSECNGLTSVTIPNSVTTIGRQAFQYCSGLISITIPNFITSIAYGTFAGCRGLTSITIPNFVKTIEESAFIGCESLTSVTIGRTVKSIGQYAFANCSALTEVCSKIDVPFNINKNCFKDVTKKNATLYVPKGTKELYQAAEGWDFVNIDDGLVYHQLTLTADEGGSISFYGEAVENASVSFEIREGETATITVVPNQNYELNSLKMNGVNVKNEMIGNTFTISDIRSDLDIIATFSRLTSVENIMLSNNLQTFCCKDDLDFSNVDGVKAYIVSGFKSATNEVLLTPISEVPAGTGLLLKGDAGKTYDIPFYETTYIYSNLLKGVLSNTQISSGYILNGEYFEQVSVSTTVPANSAYLVLPSSTQNAKKLSLIFSDETSEIYNIEKDNEKLNDVWYTLQGVKLQNKPIQPGIYVRNNHKVIVR